MTPIQTYKARQSRHRWVRWIVLGSVTVLLATVGYLHQHPLFGMTPPGVDALCPFGGLEALWMFATTGDLMTKIAASSFILLVASIGITILFRRAFCGQLCPLGALQGASAGIGKKLFGRKFKLPAVVDMPLRWLKYVVLAGLTALTWIAGTLVVRPYDPWVAFMHLSSAEVWTGFWVGALILIGSLIASLFYDRFFCKYLCPMGAMYGLVSKLGLYRVRRDETKCIDCGKCDKVCPVDLPVSKVKDVTSAECLACGLCVNACPVKDTLAFAGPKNTKISPLFLTLATVVVFFGVVALTAIPGWFHTSTLSLAEEARGSGGPTLAASVEMPAFDPDLIKGKNTFAEVADLTGIERHAFVEKFGITEADLEKPIKDSANALGTFATGDVRVFVAEKLGIQGYVSAETEMK
ncbi:MAG: 4Fe-4S binding protein [Spirochaetales bacterium]